MDTRRAFVGGVGQRFYLWGVQGVASLAQLVVPFYNERRPTGWPELNPSFEQWVILFLLGVLLAAYFAYRDLERGMRRDFNAYSAVVEGHHVTTPQGRKLLARDLLHRHGLGVSDFQDSLIARWSTTDEILKWLTRNGEWKGEIIQMMRERGCPADEIHNIGVLTSPVHIPGYAPHGTGDIAGERDFYLSNHAERLARIRDLIDEYNK